jgi:hypothetical protein
MPIHDWTRVDAGLFHDFHQSWTVALRNALNAGGLPPDYFALIEERVGGPIPDVLTLQMSPAAEGPSNGVTALAVATAPPRTRLIRRNEGDVYAARANRITIRHRHGRVVAVIEIVSPGNKGSRNELRTFVEKSADLIRQQVNLLDRSVSSDFARSTGDPQGNLGRVHRRGLRAAARPAAHAGRVRRGAGASRLRRIRRGGGRAARHAAVPQTGALRPGPPGGDLPGDVEAVPRPAQGAAGRTAPRAAGRTLICLLARSNPVPGWFCA